MKRFKLYSILAKTTGRITYPVLWNLNLDPTCKIAEVKVSAVSVEKADFALLRVLISG